VVGPEQINSSIVDYTYGLDYLKDEIKEKKLKLEE
jgi:hypothetical protein